MAAHVERDDAVVARELGRDVVESVRMALVAVNEDQRRFVGRAALKIVQAKPVDRHVTV